MKTFRNRFLLPALALFLLVPAEIFAGDYATLNFVGFSNDGKYLAFEEYGTQDGSGAPYSNYYFIDVAKNAYAAAPVRKIVKEPFDEETMLSEAEVRALAKKAAAANLKKFGIVAGNTGKMLVARLLTDLSAEKIEPGDENKNQTIRFTDYRSSDYFAKEYELILKTSKVDLKRCDYNYEPTLIFELALKDTNEDTAKILQKDAALPESRGCPHTYSIEKVFVHKNKIAVFMNVYTMGFEGPDMRYMVVTGNYM